MATDRDWTPIFSQCLSAEHKRWLAAVGAPGLIFVVAGVPLAATAIVFAGRHGRLKDPQFAFRFGAVIILAFRKVRAF
eukprot:tig00000147_g9483.t1